MHATPPNAAAFALALGRTYTCAAIRGIGGMAGGPLCVQQNGTYYPAGIYLGGTDQSIVRSIDKTVLDLISRAEDRSNGGGNNTDGGSTLPGVDPIGNADEPGTLKVTIVPCTTVCDSGAWRKAGRISTPRKAGGLTTEPDESSTTTE